MYALSSANKGTWAPIILATAGAALGLLSAASVVQLQQQQTAQSWLQGNVHRLPLYLQQLSSVNQGVALLIDQADGQLGPQRLEQGAPRLLADLTPGTAIRITPRGGRPITLPRASSSIWNGLQRPQDSAEHPTPQEGLVSKGAVLWGPVPLAQGGMGVVVESPVFIGEQRRFWGSVKALGPWPSWWRELQDHAARHRLPLQVAVQVRDSRNHTVRSADYRRIQAVGVESQPIELMDARITLAAAPSALAPRQALLMALAPIAGGLLGGGFGGVLMERRGRQQALELDLEREKRRAMERYQTLFADSLDAVALINEDLHFVEANPAVIAMFGAADLEVFLSITPLDFSPPTQPDGRPSAQVAVQKIREAFDTGAVEFEYLHKRLDTGEEWLGLVSLRRIALDREPLLMARVRDITATRRYGERLVELAYRDSLTGLPNRPATLEWIAGELQRHPEQRLLLINLDVDDFRSLNDVYGQELGDRLLVVVAQVLPQQLPEGSWVARLHSDEFLLVVPWPADSPSTPADLQRWVGALQEGLGRLLADPAQALPRLSFSAGCALHPGGAACAAELLQQANTALQQAKQGGRNTCELYCVALSDLIQARLALEQDLDRALDQALAPGAAAEAFRLVYQPQVNRAGRVVRAEALLRFRSSEGSDVSPDVFIPLAERNGQIHRLGSWVLERAFAQQAQWQAQGLAIVPLSVNISARQLDDVPGAVPLMAQLQELLARYQLEPRHFVLELTETALSRDDQRLGQQLRELVAAGFRISLDDFGSGYSSLTGLRDYPVAQVKIDKSFVKHVGLDPRSCAIVEALVLLTRARRMDLVAEGVETPDQREVLQHLGLKLFQGYLFAPGLPPEAFAELLRNPDALASPRPGLSAA